MTKQRILSNIERFMAKCKDDKIGAYAAQSAFFIMLSAIPFLMVFSSILQFTPLTEDVVLEFVRRVSPDYVEPFFLSIVDEVYNRSTGTISVTAVVAIWSAAKGIHYVSDGFNSVNDLQETRNWLALRLWAIVYTLVFLVAIILSLVVLVFGNSLIDMIVMHIPVLEGALDLFSKLKGIVMFVMLILFFDVIFKTLPNRKLTLRSQMPGAIICSVAWSVFSFGVSIYVDYFNGFSMYGSLTTIAMIMLWLYFCIYIMFLSAEVNVVYEEHFRKVRGQISEIKSRIW